MAPSIVAVLAIGGLLGLRHAFEPDHLAAVSTLATRPGGRRLWSAARLGLIWGLGHTVTVGAVALLIIALGVRLPDRFWPAAELLVAGVPVPPAGGGGLGRVRPPLALPPPPPTPPPPRVSLPTHP